MSRGSPAQGPVVDLLFASSGIEPDIVAGADRLELVDGLVLPIAQTAHLIALKVLARDDVERPQDIVDLRALPRVASASDLDEARRALEAIDARGFHRGRDLMAELEQLLA